MEKQRLEEITEKFCEGYCKHTEAVISQDEFDEKCEKCPMNELFELLDYEVLIMKSRCKNRLYLLRKKHKLSQDEVCEKTGIQKRSLYNYERDLSPIPSDKLIEFAKFYKCTTDHILCFDDESYDKKE